MMIANNLSNILKQLPEKVKLVAVSKTKSNAEIMEAYFAGQRLFGENKVQELVTKYELLPKDIQWHFIGHLQTNKVKFIAPFVNLIHAVDSFKLLKTIDNEAKKVNRVIPCLLQFHIAEEETKFGLSFEEATEILSSTDFNALKNIEIAGVMGMATFTDDQNHVRREFDELFRIFHSLKDRYFNENDNFREISMGMSDDYSIAIERGSTMVRIGSKIFGSRQCAIN
jgi:pyridoxal phosphate enzyme (YggS family)